MKKRVVIIGGGIAGLTAAYYLQKEIREQGLQIDMLLIEASGKVGGKIQTVRKEGFTIERGPDSFLERKESAARLVKEVGLGDELVNNKAGQSFVLVNNQLHKIPSGSMMGIPTQITPFLFSGLFSPIGKLRASFDFVLPRSKPVSDQSLGQFFRRRFGNEVVENLIEPLLAGIYAGDIDQMSLMATFPKVYQIEQKYRSISLGMRALAPKRTKDVKPKGMFLTLKTGLESLVEAIEEKLDTNTVMKGTRVEKVKKLGDGYEITLSNGKEIEADAVIIAAPHKGLPSMFGQYKEFRFFRNIPATSVANVALAFPKEAIKRDIDGTGFVVSRNSDFSITACTWAHKKWPHTTPDGKVLLRCYVGRPGDEAIVEQTDEEIIQFVLEDLQKTMDIVERPDFTVVSRWKDAMPQYTVGHKKRMKKLTAFLKQELPGIYLAGSSYAGSGLPDCIDQGEAAVKYVLSYLEERNKTKLIAQ
ncbi:MULTISPECIES: protoporphyrinogen oxidase [Bacillus cereus group]|uniref:Coproporphyrinogen III oxidase n=1 Tax=Bacillus cytotoxicus TaxID=580165 RepID=A0AAX2CDJ7_9BACI|nr:MULTISPECIES: protoporphyrinogen oxidase [Bacillus cereus group]AWC27813.1 protoporphyrinogen oxidase [Bacillus cytotoxicus]AWC40808.1 protoporphyrinogen oxidase [Bacillus cytotoxicus]AWC48739.1 protoporphyrinogen oxidase [Bacillus cytotoxicus]AWC51882.1 protoporphyrinogen oxidase [Bacillus cytotoxicus]AWC56011.1 protoporphyrinogen oxidase [Bacillus cytotoxicus]